MTHQPTNADHPHDGAAILDALHACLTKYVILPSPEAVDAVALWITASHAQPAWAHAARLVIRAPEKRCGKSRLLDVVEATCYAPLITVNASPAAVYRAIGTDDPPTLLVDEADTIFGAAADGNEDLRGLLNAGHQRNRPAIRWDAAAQKVEKIPTFSMAALAGIGAMPDTIEDRAVVVRMRRRAPGETVAPYRHRRDSPALRALARQLTAWLRVNLRDLETAEPAMPVEDRAADTWEPLVAVADLAGDTWPQRARQACETLTADRDGNAVPSDRIRLLADCRAVFRSINAVDNQGRPAIPSSVLLNKLRTDPEAPWAEYGKAGTGLTAMKLGQLLAEYEIRSANIRFGSPYGQVKGYYQADFTDAWNRYCPAPNPAPPSQPSQPSQPSSTPGRVIPLGRLKPSQPTTAHTTAGTA